MQMREESENGRDGRRRQEGGLPAGDEEEGGEGVVGGRVSDIAPTVITARSAYGSSCRALCFLPGKYGWNIN